MEYKIDCPICFNSSGILANGRATTCKDCKGTGIVNKTKYLKLQKLYPIIPPIKFKK